MRRTGPLGSSVVPGLSVVLSHSNMQVPWQGCKQVFFCLDLFMAFSLFFVSLSSFVDDTSSTSECSVLSKKRFTLQGFTNLKSQKGNFFKKARLFSI